MYYSPLRYPGGKGKLASFMEYMIDQLGHQGGTYIEPFAGGAGIAMELLLRNVVSPPTSIAKTFLSRFLPFFTTRGNYKYYIIKYKVWQDFVSGTYNNYTLTPTDTNYYYHIAIPTSDIGSKNIEIKYERS